MNDDKPAVLFPKAICYDVAEVRKSDLFIVEKEVRKQIYHKDLSVPLKIWQYAEEYPDAPILLVWECGLRHGASMVRKRVLEAIRDLYAMIK